LGLGGSTVSFHMGSAAKPQPTNN